MANFAAFSMILMSVIHSLTFRFDDADDRIVLVCRLHAKVLPLMLTRRLAFRLLAKLCDIVAEQSAAAGQIDESWRDDLLSMTHARSVAHVNEAQQQIASSEWAEAVPADAAVLLTRIELQRESQGCGLIFFGSTADALCQMNFSQTQLHWFVSRLHKFILKADWGCAIPEPTWLQDESRSPKIGDDGQTAMLH